MQTLRVTHESGREQFYTSRSHARGETVQLEPDGGNRSPLLGGGGEGLTVTQESTLPSEIRPAGGVWSAVGDRQRRQPQIDTDRTRPTGSPGAAGGGGAVGAAAQTN